jgi:hypothetical protein
MNVDHATLSQLMRGRRRLTARSIRCLGRRLRLPASDVLEYIEREREAAVLDAVGRPGFRPTSRWLATMTGQPQDAVNVTLQRLLRTRQLAMVAPG